jgi:DNA-binding LacI/PurR family transcriptional regulator
MKRLTLEDIAREAGVSKQTVSRVINHNPDVARETRTRVQDIINRLGYQPNQIARSLSAKRTRTIAVVISKIDQYGPRAILLELDQQAHAAGYRLLPYIIHETEPSDLDAYLRNLLSHQPDGVIWAISNIGDLLESLSPDSSLPIPIVATDINVSGIQSAVAVAHVQASQMAVAHLIEQGSQHVGVITGPPNWAVSRLRLEGWRQGLIEAGLPPDDHQIVQGDWSAQSGYEAMTRLLSQYPQVDAVFASNDQMALGVLHLLYERGIHVPDAMCVAGYDDIPEAAYFSPGLTTIRQPYTDICRITVQTLVRLIDAHNADEPYPPIEKSLLYPKLIVRGSSLRKKAGETIKLETA